MAQEMDGPGNAEEDEASEDIPHSLGIEMPDARQISVDGLRGGIEQEKKEGTAEPGHLRAEEAPGFVAPLRGQPKGFVWQIDVVGRHQTDHARNKEGDDRAQDDHKRHQHEESLFWLPAVGCAVGREVRSHAIRKLWIDMDPLQHSQHQHQEEQKSGKTRIVHGRFVSSLGRMSFSGNWPGARHVQEVLAFPG